MKRLIASAALVVLGSLCTAPAAQSRSAIFLAIVRSDGALVPIAIHDGRE